MAQFFLERWRSLTAGDEPKGGAGGKIGWRDVALTLAEHMNSPMRDVENIGLAEAAEWMDAIRRRNEKADTRD